MSRKNPENKPLRIVRTGRGMFIESEYARALLEIMKCQAMLVRGGKDSAMPHFIACVKALEKMHEFKFEVMEDGTEEV